MAPKRKPSVPSDWILQLDAQELEEARDEATVDCYGDDEFLSGLLTMAQQELVVPFEARVIGQRVSVVDTEWTDGTELALVVEFNEQRHRVAAHSVELHPPFPDGAVWLAAYLDFHRKR